ncbi:MAG: succinylglutamate desuccinylase/aspartoacylase family protein [Candidatus Omnitrophica bacterium]|nr:succinylglutamate desuccinylase/aspartoacylase family protein [Candidatus Omnitrophota bacterium]
MKKPKRLVIGGVDIQPGERKSVNLFVSKLYDYTEIHMPVKVIRGKEPGPTAFVCAALHGDEINGVEIIKRLLQKDLLKTIRGTLIAVPIVNVYGFNNLSRYLPDRRDLNRIFPGSNKGSLAARLADLFIKEVVSKCDYGVDLHTGAIHRTNLPQVRASLKDETTKSLALNFGVPVVMDAEHIEGSLRTYCFQKKIPLIVFEGGEALRYDEGSIKSGLAGIVSFMRAIGMLPALKSKKQTRIKSAIAQGNHWVRASGGGILKIKKKLGSPVDKGDLMGIISDPFGEDKIDVRAVGKGIIIGQTQIPLVNRGDALFHVATFEKTEHVIENIEAFEDQFDINTG